MTREEPTPRQILYALVAAGFLVVTAVLTAGAATTGVSPLWWTLVVSGAVGITAIWMAFNWRKTAIVLLLAMGLFLAWTVGTLIVS